MPTSTLAENVLSRRRAQGLSRERLAVAADTSVSTIVRLERDGKAPSLPILERIAAVLDVSTARLLSPSDTKRAS